MKLVPRSRAYRNAELEAKVARADFMRSVDEARARLSPGRLKKDATRQLRQIADNAQRETIESARKHPFIIGGVTATVIAWIFRRPLMALSQRAGVSIRKAWDARNRKKQEMSDE